MVSSSFFLQGQRTLNTAKTETIKTNKFYIKVVIAVFSGDFLHIKVS